MNVESALPAKRIRTQQVVVNFDISQFRTPFLLRCGALLIDYVLLISIPVISILLARFTGADGAKLLNSEINSAGWLITFLLGLTNLVILPLFTGQSIGKMLTGLRIVMMDGTFPKLGNLLLRHLVGYPLTILTCGLGFILSAFNEYGRTLHDGIAGTVVVYGRRRIERKVLTAKNKLNAKQGRGKKNRL